MQIILKYYFQHADASNSSSHQQPAVLLCRRNALTLRAGRGIALDMMSASPVRWSTCAYMAGHCRHEKLYLICPQETQQYMIE
jgi:hypothetical protein